MRDHSTADEVAEEGVLAGDTSVTRDQSHVRSGGLDHLASDTDMGQVQVDKSLVDNLMGSNCIMRSEIHGSDLHVAPLFESLQVEGVAVAWQLGGGQERGAVHGRSDLGWVAQPKDTTDIIRDHVVAANGGCKTESVVLDGDVGVTFDTDCVFDDLSGELAIDSPLASITFVQVLECGRLFVLEKRVEEAREGPAIFRVDVNVGNQSLRFELEGLGWSADVQFHVVVPVSVVTDEDLLRCVGKLVELLAIPIFSELVGDEWNLGR